MLLTATAILGVHLIEPYLLVTYFDTPDYENLISTMRQLYDDLRTTDVKELLDISRPAFKFVNEKQIIECVKWDEEVLNTIKVNINQYSKKIESVLSLILPELANGFFIQRGDVFGFGSYDPNSSKLVTKYDLSILNQAPINNLDAERAVGSINYELRLRGATELEAVSNSFVKNKSYDLIELQPVDAYKNYMGAAKSVNKLVRNWIETQFELEKEGMNKKEIACLATDKRRMKDLNKLKLEGGPFTKAEEVSEFVSRKDITNKIKQERLYTEVRYARDMSLSLPKNSELFRLKEKYKSLSIEKFSQNLKVYLGKVSANSSANWEDFDQAIASLKSKI